MDTLWYSHTMDCCMVTKTLEPSGPWMHFKNSLLNRSRTQECTQYPISIKFRLDNTEYGVDHTITPAQQWRSWCLPKRKEGVRDLYMDGPRNVICDGQKLGTTQMSTADEQTALHPVDTAWQPEAFYWTPRQQTYGKRPYSECML